MKVKRVVVPDDGPYTLPDGRVLARHDEFTVRGEGRYSFRYERLGEITCWGPVGSARARMRTFGASRVSTIHRKKVLRVE